MYHLILYGTGFRNRTDLTNVKVKIGGIDAPVEYAGAQGFYAGLDQLNVKVPRTLAGQGTVNIELSADGKSANLTAVTFK